MTADRVFYAAALRSSTINGPFTLTLGNGAGQAGLTLNGATFAGNGLAFGAAEATVFTTAAGGTIAANTTVTGTGGLTKFGPGTLIVNGTLNVTGPITVNGGRLVVNGSVGGGTSVNVGPGQTLGGSGTIASPVTIAPGGNLSPGNSPGTLTLTSATTLTPGSVFEVELGGTTAGQSDLVALGSTGTIDLGGATLKASLVNGYAPQFADSITIITGSATNAVAGQFDGVGPGESVIVSAGSGIDYFAKMTYGPSSVTLSEFTPVSEPGGLLLIAGVVAAVFAGDRGLRSRRVSSAG